VNVFFVSVKGDIIPFLEMNPSLKCTWVQVRSKVMNEGSKLKKKKDKQWEKFM
jgi:hypothetical protein